MKGEVYNQSLCVMNKAAWYYYEEGKSQAEIAERLQISKATVSRILKKAGEQRIFSICYNEPFRESILIEKKLVERFGLKEAIVLPVGEAEELMNPEEVKKKVALEGARYVQRIIEDGDQVGLAWGGTMYYLIQYLNPCRKVRANMITLHGSVMDCDEKFDVKSLVKRASMAFGGQNMIINDYGFAKTPEKFREIITKRDYSSLQEAFRRIDISVSGVGSLYPEADSPIVKAVSLPPERLRELRDREVRSDIILRFIDKDGRECDTSLKENTLSIALDDYRKIPCKIIVASGSRKAESVRALLKGGLVDVLTVDCHLARAILG